MDNATHTPGPWTIEDGYINGRGGTSVAMMMYDTEQAKRDARLISAAPDLLQAATVALEFFDSGPMRTSRENVVLVGLLRSAIEKATSHE